MNNRIPHALWKPKPAWLRQRLPAGPNYEKMRSLLARLNLHTVCEEAICPNRWECFSNQTAAFLILGNTCTRDCRFCGVAHGIPCPPDPAEPARVARAAAELNLDYVVVTSVTRDDLSDGGASFFARTVNELRISIPKVKVEVLIPDFKGDLMALKALAKANPDVINHNIETGPRLYAAVRPQASYQRSLDVLKYLRKIAPHIETKSGLMVGLGETLEEVDNVLSDLYESGCRLLTIGQYLQPSEKHLPVSNYVEPMQFGRWQKKALAIGFKAVACGPFVRSSYHAEEIHGKILS